MSEFHYTDRGTGNPQQAAAVWGTTGVPIFEIDYH